MLGLSFGLSFGDMFGLSFGDMLGWFYLVLTFCVIDFNVYAI